MPYVFAVSAEMRDGAAGSPFHRGGAARSNSALSAAARHADQGVPRASGGGRSIVRDVAGAIRIVAVAGRVDVLIAVCAAPDDGVAWPCLLVLDFDELRVVRD